MRVLERTQSVVGHGRGGGQSCRGIFQERTTSLRPNHHRGGLSVYPLAREGPNLSTMVQTGDRRAPRVCACVAFLPAAHWRDATEAAKGEAFLASLVYFAKVLLIAKY